MAVANPITTSTAQEGMSRRNLLRAAPAAGLAAMMVSAVPVAAAAEAMSAQDRIKLHAEAIMALVRDEFPADATSLSVIIGSNWGQVPYLNRKLSICASAAKYDWAENKSMRDGGMWVQRDVGYWEPKGMAELSAVEV